MTAKRKPMKPVKAWAITTPCRLSDLYFGDEHGNGHMVLPVTATRAGAQRIVDEWRSMTCVIRRVEIREVTR